MPITPREVEAFMYSADEVDAAIKFIDNILGSTREKHYRHGDPNDYFYEIDVVGNLTTDHYKELKAAYVCAGWGNLQVKPCVRDSGKTTVRLFFNTRSKYI